MHLTMKALQRNLVKKDYRSILTRNMRVFCSWQNRNEIKISFAYFKSKIHFNLTADVTEHNGSMQISDNLMTWLNTRHLLRRATTSESQLEGLTDATILQAYQHLVSPLPYPSPAPHDTYRGWLICLNLKGYDSLLDAASRMCEIAFEIKGQTLHVMKYGCFASPIVK